MKLESYDARMNEVNETRAERAARTMLTNYNLGVERLEPAVLAFMVDALHLAARDRKKLNLVRLAQEAEKERPRGELRI